MLWRLFSVILEKYFIYNDCITFADWVIIIINDNNNVIVVS